MKKFYIAGAILIPLVGCTGVVGDESSVFGTDPNGLFDPTGAGGTTANPGSSGSATVTGTAGSTVVAGSGSNTGPGGGVGMGGGAPVGGSATVGGNSSGSGSGGACTLDVLPATVQNMLNSRCATCHGTVPLATTLPTLLSYADLIAPAKSDPSKTNAVVSLARLQNATMPMPPSPGAPASASEISALQDFISQGYPKPSCPVGMGGAGGGSSGGSAGAGMGGNTGMGGGPSNDPLMADPICTSKTNWTNGNRGSSSMNPGMACISCHKSGEGPSFSIAGTVYPTGHEPDKCNSTVGNAGARIVIIGADGKTLTLTPNGVGNFTSNTAVKTPYQAKVTYQGRERLMLTAQTSGDCNSCHTANGTMMAPGRITVP